MTIVETQSGYTYSIPETLPAKPVDRVVTGMTVLDAADGDGTHILLKGTIPAGDEYIRCENSSGVEKFGVKHDGTALVHDLQTSTIPSLNNDWSVVNDAIAEIDDLAAQTLKVEDAEPVSLDHGPNDDDTLVKRGTNGSYCVINDLQAHRFRSLGATPQVALYGNGAFQFIPLDSQGNNIANCEYSFGKRLANFGDQTQAGDGLFIKNDDNTVELEARKAAPSIRITGDKNAGVDYFQIIDSNDDVVYSIDRNGKVQPSHHLLDTVLSDVPDLEGHSGVFESESIYVGPVKISYDKTSGILKQQVLNRIPLVLQSAPYSITNADLGGRSYSDLSARQWVVLARTKSNDPSVQVRDILTTAADWDDHYVHHAMNLTSDAQSQLDAITTDITDLETLTTSMNADVTTAETNISTLQNEMDAAEQALSILSTASVCYVDCTRTETYTEDGSPTKPYKTLQDAMTAKLTEGATQTIMFKLANGTYNVGSGISIERTTATQSFGIVGDGQTFVRCTDLTTDILYLRRFKEILFKDVTFEVGKYGIYTRDTDAVTVLNCVFAKLGSLGTTAQHDRTHTQAEQAAVWAGTNTSNGGAMRLRASSQVFVIDCKILLCLRGIRVQDITGENGSIISRNTVVDTLESGIYCASGSYAFDNAGANGCRHVTIIGNRILRPYNNGILVVGSRFVDVTNNQIYQSANAGIQQWSSVDCTYQNNYLYDCNTIQHNGIGNLGDAWSVITIGGNDGITTTSGDLIATVTNNTTVKAGQGRASTTMNIRVSETAGVQTAYPGSNYKLKVDLNTSDAQTEIENPASETLDTQYYRQSEVDALLAAKQSTIGAGDLHIAYTNGLQTALDAKQDTQTFAASRAIVSGQNGGLRNSTVTSAEILHLDGVTSSIQTQLDGKQATIGDGDLTIARTSGLQTTLDGKQDSLQMSVVNGDGDVFSSSGQPQC